MREDGHEDTRSSPLRFTGQVTHEAPRTSARGVFKFLLGSSEPFAIET